MVIWDLADNGGYKSLFTLSSKPDFLIVKSKIRYPEECLFCFCPYNESLWGEKGFLNKTDFHFMEINSSDILQNKLSQTYIFRTT